MPKKQIKTSSSDKLNVRSLYLFSVAAGLVIAFLMFNDVIMAVLFGVPIGIVLGLALQDNVRRRESKR